MRHKISEVLPIKEAMDNLAAIASINMESPPPIGIVDNVRLVTSADELESSSVRWLSGEGAMSLLQVLDLTYRSVYENLMSLYENPGMDWESEKSRSGVAAMMSLVGESVQKMNAYLEFRLNKAEKIEQRESFRALSRFYSERFAKKFVGGIEGTDAWENAWHQKKNSLLEASGTEIQDFESLLRDKEYELFYVANEEGAPYLDETLLRNLKLTVDFDIPSGSFEEDPFLKVKTILDRDIHASASWIIRECAEEISTFYKLGKKIFHHPCAALLSKAVMALLLASNTQHLLSRSTGKSCTHYFNDFHHFLRSAMKSDDYQKWVTYPPREREVEAYTCTSLILKLCFSFVHRPCGVKQEAIGLIHRTMRRGNEIDPTEKGDTPWSKLILDDEKFRTLLLQFPSGPLLKILDTVRHSQEEGITTPFDPWIQGNLPQKLYTIRRGKQEVELLSFAAPIRQPMIHRVEINDEFRGFLRYLKQVERKHLIINLQDRLSWRETARSTGLEELQNTSVFEDTLFVMTLPKDTDFYHQKNEFANINDAHAFISAFEKQIENGEHNGFYFPRQWRKEDLHQFCKAKFSQIHKFVFESKNVLTRAMREDFIEIFYQFITLEAMDRFQVDSISFTSKDSVDAGAYAAGMFYGFLKAYEGNLLTTENLDFIRFLFYWRALSIRERASDPEQFYRSISTLETWNRAIEEQQSKMTRALNIEWRV